MSNEERFRKAKKLMSKAKELLEPIKDDLQARHESKFQLLYDQPSPTRHECDKLNTALCEVISMICDLEELEETSIAIPL